VLAGVVAEELLVDSALAVLASDAATDSLTALVETLVAGVTVVCSLVAEVGV